MRTYNLKFQYHQRLNARTIMDEHRGENEVESGCYCMHMQVNTVLHRLAVSYMYIMRYVSRSFSLSCHFLPRRSDRNTSLFRRRSLAAVISVSRSTARHLRTASIVRTAMDGSCYPRQWKRTALYPAALSSPPHLRTPSASTNLGR